MNTYFKETFIHFSLDTSSLLFVGLISERFAKLFDSLFNNVSLESARTWNSDEGL